jgi:hypothetical protein
VLFWFDARAKETVRSASKIRPDQNTVRMGVHHDPDKYSLDGGVCDFCEYQRLAFVLGVNLRGHDSPIAITAQAATERFGSGALHNYRNRTGWAHT